MLGKTPQGPRARVRDFIARAHLGAEMVTIHEKKTSRAAWPLGTTSGQS
jgi:hypothetical protein